MKTAKKAARKTANKAAKRGRGGRPTTYSAEVAARICEEVAAGKSLRSIGGIKGFPTRETIRVWLGEHAEFAVQYARAREEQADFYADEMVEIADTTKDANRARLQIDARKWKASKLAPKKYGDKLDITTRDETPPVSRAEMVEKMRKSPGFLKEIEAMVEEAKRTPTDG